MLSSFAALCNLFAILPKTNPITNEVSAHSLKPLEHYPDRLCIPHQEIARTACSSNVTYPPHHQFFLETWLLAQPISNACRSFVRLRWQVVPTFIYTAHARVALAYHFQNFKQSLSFCLLIYLSILENERTQMRCHRGESLAPASNHLAQHQAGGSTSSHSTERHIRANQRVIYVRQRC